MEGRGRARQGAEGRRRGAEKGAEGHGRAWKFVEGASMGCSGAWEAAEGLPSRCGGGARPSRERERCGGRRWRRAMCLQPPRVHPLDIAQGLHAACHVSAPVSRPAVAEEGTGEREARRLITSDSRHNMRGESCQQRPTRALGSSRERNPSFDLFVSSYGKQVLSRKRGRECTRTQARRVLYCRVLYGIPFARL